MVAEPQLCTVEYLLNYWWFKFIAEFLRMEISHQTTQEDSLSVGRLGSQSEQKLFLSYNIVFAHFVSFGCFLFLL